MNTSTCNGGAGGVSGKGFQYSINNKQSPSPLNIPITSTTTNNNNNHIKVTNTTSKSILNAAAAAVDDDLEFLMDDSNFH